MPTDTTEILDNPAPPPVNTIDAQELSSPAAGNLYKVATPTQTALETTASAAVAAKDAALKRIESETQNLEKTGQTYLGRVTDTLSRIGNLGARRQELEKGADIQAKREGVDSIANEIDSTERSYDKLIREAESNAEGRFGGGDVTVVQRLKKEKAEHLADLNIILGARSRDLNTAQNAVDAKVELDTADLKATLDGQQFLYEENKDNLTDKQKTLLEDKISTAKEALATAKEERSTIAKLQLQAAENGAPNSVVRAIGAAESYEDAITAGDGYFQKPGSGSGAGVTFKFDAGGKEALVAAGLSANEITQLQQDINTYGLDSALAGFVNEDGTPDEAMQKRIRTAVTGSDTSQFLTEDWLNTTFANSSVADMLKTMGKERSDYAAFWQSASTEEATIKTDFKAYIKDALIPLIQQYRDAGMTDREILDKMR